jgi:uncharacterized protein
MIGDAVVIDGIGHALDVVGDNCLNPKICAQFERFIYHGAHLMAVPKDEPQWDIGEDRFQAGALADVDLLSSALFRESWTDAVSFHGVPMFGLYREGMSPLRIGLELRRRHPGRVFLYGPVSPFEPEVNAEIDRLVDEDRVDALKLYPADFYGAEIKHYQMDDRELIYPLLEHARSRGISVIAIHKAIPLGPAPTAPFRVEDLDAVLYDFPDLTFEVVHGGYAFLDETVMQAARFPNVVVNLEVVASFLANAPRRFMEIVGAFLAEGAADKVIWGTGCSQVHPQPLLERFWAMRFPQDLEERFGVVGPDEETKRAILAGNFARIHGLDLASLAEGSDHRGSTDELAAPWSGQRLEVG